MLLSEAKELLRNNGFRLVESRMKPENEIAFKVGQSLQKGGFAKMVKVSGNFIKVDVMPRTNQYRKLRRYADNVTKYGIEIDFNEDVFEAYIVEREGEEQPIGHNQWDLEDYEDGGADYISNKIVRWIKETIQENLYSD